MSGSEINKIKVSSSPFPQILTKECDRCMEEIGGEEFVYNCDKQTTQIFHESCWLDGLSDTIFHNTVNRIAMQISKSQGYDKRLLELMK